jgi:transposase
MTPIWEVKMKKPKAVPPQVKFQAALEAIKGEKSLVELARIYNVHPNTIVKWKAELMGHARRA